MRIVTNIHNDLLITTLWITMRTMNYLTHTLSQISSRCCWLLSVVDNLPNMSLMSLKYHSFQQKYNSLVWNALQAADDQVTDSRFSDLWNSGLSQREEKVWIIANSPFTHSKQSIKCKIIATDISIARVKLWLRLDEKCFSWFSASETSKHANK